MRVYICVPAGDPRHSKRTTPLPSSSLVDNRNAISKVLFYELSASSIQTLQLKVDNSVRIVSLCASANGNASFAIDQHRNAYMWGKIDCEASETEIERVPMPVVIIARSNTGEREKVVAISAGSRHAVCVTDNGLAWSFGGGGPWLGLGPNSRSYQPRPVQIPFPGNVLVSGVCCGESHTVLSTISGKILTCGKPDFGRLGLGKRARLCSARYLPA